MTTPRKEHPYASFIERVSKPSRYLGGEHGETLGDWDAVDCRICLAFPDVYEIGMSHLGFKILYAIVNRHPRLLAERAYAPWTDMEKELRARNEPLRSLETWKALSEFDVVGFSLQFELTFTNILLMLETGGIPLRSEQRGENDPLVIAGGPTATHPEPLAPFIDAFVIGDGEEKTPELMLTWSALKKAGLPRRERLARLAELGGIYVPALYELQTDPDTDMQYVARTTHTLAPLPVKRAFVEKISDHPFPADGPVANTETVFDRVSVEISRGCTEGCRFCQAGMIYRPVREREPQEIVDTILGAVRGGGYDEASLTSLSTADYSAIAPLVRKVMGELEEKRVSLSVSSLRAYGLGEELLDEIQKVRATGLTFAPEAGSQRMRDVVNKNVTEEQLMETAERVFSRGWSKMKLYFMIGLPTEEEEDVLGIARTGARARDVGKRVQKGRPPNVTVSVSTHVPKPHTPFQWAAMDARETVLDKQAMLRDEARKGKVKLRMHDSKGSWLEGILARGDRSLAAVVEDAYRAGARFDSWEEHLDLKIWEQAMEQHGIQTSRFLGTIPVTAQLPWQHIDVGLEEDFLAREYRKAMKNRLSPPCGKAVGTFIHHTNLAEHREDARKLVCYNCGIACDMTAMRDERADKLVTLGAERPAAPSADRDRVMTPQQRRPKASFDQGPPVRVRLRYTKLGRAAFRSHLDLVRLLPRMFRRLDLPMHYSQGFHPKPEMTFGPALPLGVASLGELVDVKLCESDTLDYEQLGDLLGGNSLEGVTFLDARLLGNQDASLSRRVNRARYAVGLPVDALRALKLDSVEALTERIAGRRGGDGMTVERRIKGIVKRVKVEDFLTQVEAGAGAQSLREAGIAGDLLPLRFELAITPRGTARPYEVLQALFGEDDLPARMVRETLSFCPEEELGSESRLDPMQIETLRSSKAVPGQGAEAAPGPTGNSSAICVPEVVPHEAPASPAVTPDGNV